MTKKEEQRQKRERARIVRETETAHCVMCGEPVTLEDRNADGSYLHRDCARRASTR